MAGVAAVFGQLERELNGQRTSEALAELRDQGRVYGPIPYGYERDGEVLVPFGAEQRVLDQILDMRLSRLSYGKIADWLNAEGITAKRGGGWSPMAVRSVCNTSARRQKLAA